MGFQELIEFIRDGEQVRAGVANRSTRALDGNVRYLRDLLEASLRGEALIAFAKTVNPSVREGQAVYFDSRTLQYEPALAQTEIDALTGRLVTAASGQVWGVVLKKVNATSADILLGGTAEVDLAEAVIGDVQLGKLYYLSGLAAGKLTPERPPVGIPVLIVGQQGLSKHEVFVNPQFYDFLDEHTHTRFDLVAEPAGDHVPPTPGGAHVITNANSAVEGWLPADDAIFEGKAPAGAKFGYNLSASPLGKVWPPTPLQAASVEIYRLSAYDPSPNPHFPKLGRVPDQVVVINQDGLWWMTDCYDAVPWPTHLDNTNPTSVSSSQGLCPVGDAVDDVLLTLWYTNVTFYTSNTAVLSLRGREGSGLTVYCRNTDLVKEVGHLEVDLDLSILVNSGNQPGYLAFKTYDAETKTFKRGPVVESVRSGSPELTVTSDVVTAGPNGEKYGNLLLQVATDLYGSNFPVYTVRLDGVEEEFYEDVLGLGFASDRASGFRGVIDIPSRLALPANTQMKLRFWLLGRSAGTLASNIFTLSYRRVPRPSAVLTDKIALPTSDTALTLNAGATFNNPDEYVELETAPFDVASGDQVLFNLSRAGNDGYGDKLILLFQEGFLVAGGS